MRRFTISAILFIAAGFIQFSYSQILFTASLTGSQEVPAVSTTGTATAWAVLNPDMTSLTYHITYARLQTAFTASHFHKAPVDSSGGVVQPITFTGNTASGIWSNISSENLAALLKGEIYINIHTTGNSSGEIRGQLRAVEGIGFTAMLDGSQENPDVTTNAQGTAWAVLKNEGTEVEYALTFAGLSSNATASHFHNAPVDSNGGVIQGITLTDSTANGTWSGVPENFISQFLKDRMYINVHSADHPGGEIRGQLIHTGEIMFTANLEGSQENPDVATDADGTAWGVLSSDLSSLLYNVTYARLSSAFSAAHFHNAPADTNGGVVQPISFNRNQSTGTWVNMSDQMIQQLIKERVYVNVHSANNSGGEIRGQLELVDGIGFTASLDGLQEGGSVVTNAQGTGWFSYSPNALNYQITIAGLSGNLTAAHFHNAAVGTPGGVVQPITFTDSTVKSSWNDISDNLLTELAKGNLYVNVHSANYTGGEIRGQVLLSNYVSGNIPVELTSFSAAFIDGRVELRWSTATETNNSGFEIQKSSAAADKNQKMDQDWEKVGFVSGRGTSTENSVYSFIDENAGNEKAFYRLKQIDFDGTFEYSNIVEVELNTPISFKLDQNYPNPFNPSTTFSFSVPEKSNVLLKIYNILGKEVAVVMNEVKEAGNYEINFDASFLASGVYFYKLLAGNNLTTRKMTLLK